MLYLELFCKYNTLIWIIGYLAQIFRIALRKRIEAWRLTVLASVVPSDGDGDPGGH